MRIITGKARGCRLKTPKGEATRPTADRIKESLFNILGRRVEEACVLDLFAGTGALGLEALSRGAASALFVDERTTPLIEENAAKTRLSARAEIVRGDALRVLARLGALGRSFDLIFCDPPYQRGFWEKALSSVDREGLLAPDGCMIVEHGTDEEELPALKELRCVREESYGKTTRLRFFVRTAKG
ncbi:16S rRNA (guanine(966)-N(2))-methyltransferase RsmD [Selenomonas sp.]|uniref:16S rRNA (guanine(966)-N(2))-methyltransferase RsmD n=1 Tax=Selenomonas sp. TaxID=2053611 RepID=UPI003FA28CEF